MKTTLITCVLLGLCALPAAAGLKVVGSTNKSSYLPGESGTVTLSLIADAGTSESINLIGTDAPGAPVIGYNGATAPTITNGPLGAQPVGSPFIAFEFADGWSTPTFLPTPIGDTTPVPFVLFDFVVGGVGTYDLSIDNIEFFLNDTISSSFSGIVPGATVTAVPEPSSFLFLGLVGAGVGGVQYYRRRKNAAAPSEENEEEAV